MPKPNVDYAVEVDHQILHLHEDDGKNIEVVSIYIQGKHADLKALRAAAPFAPYNPDLTLHYGCFGSATLAIICNEHVKLDAVDDLIKAALQSVGTPAKTYAITFVEVPVGTFDDSAHMIRMQQEAQKLVVARPAP